MKRLISGNPEESLKSEIIGALLCGYGASLGLWFSFRKLYKWKNDIR
jgi:hypothetical protein